VESVLLAEIEIFHTRPITPTRRVALGRSLLPVDPAPGFGGLLLGGIVASRVRELDPDLQGELSRLILDLELGRRIPQPRLRHRLQEDRVGLAASRHRLRGNGDGLDFEFDEHGSAASQILGAVYAAGSMPGYARPVVMQVIRRAMRWRGPVGPALVAHLSGIRGARSRSAEAFSDPRGWALGIMAFKDADRPGRTVVQTRFRELVRAAHPDHGGSRDAAAQRILDLTEARRILLGRA
jgi:hypothetical protein